MYVVSGGDGRSLHTVDAVVVDDVSGQEALLHPTYYLSVEKMRKMVLEEAVYAAVVVVYLHHIVGDPDDDDDDDVQ